MGAPYAAVGARRAEALEVRLPAVGKEMLERILPVAGDHFRHDWGAWNLRRRESAGVPAHGCAGAPRTV